MTGNPLFREETPQSELTSRRQDRQSDVSVVAPWLASTLTDRLAAPLPPEVEFDPHVRAVRLLSDAKRISGADLLLGQPESSQRELSYVH